MPVAELYFNRLSVRQSNKALPGISTESAFRGQKASLDNFSELSNRKAIYSDRQTSLVFQAVINYKF